MTRVFLTAVAPIPVCMHVRADGEARDKFGADVLYSPIGLENTVSDMSVRAMRIGMIGWMVTISLLTSAGTSAGLSIGGIPPQISIAVSNGFLNVNYTTTGFPISLDVLVVAKDATRFGADVYVGVLAPDGQAASLLGEPQTVGFTPTVAPVLLTGPPVPLLRNVILASDTGGRFELANFAAGGPQGWYIVYAVIVATGQDPGNPRHWIASSFSPLLVTGPGSP